MHLTTQFATGVDNGAVPGFGNRFFLPVANGPGVPITAMNVVRRETRSATFAQVTIPSPMATTGMVVFQGLGTGWFTILPYTTGTVMAIAATIGTPIMDWTNRTDMGFNNLNLTGMGGITGQLQLVSGHLLQSRGGINTNLAGTNMTLVTFTPEPASAALLGDGRPRTGGSDRSRSPPDATLVASARSGRRWTRPPLPSGGRVRLDPLAWRPHAGTSMPSGTSPGCATRGGSMRSCRRTASSGRASMSSSRSSTR
jgi:hypothetical protein